MIVERGRRRGRGRWGSVLTGLLLALLTLLASTSSARAQSEPVDVILVIDDSGSMGPQYGSNDLAGLRYAAARLLVDLAGEQDRIAIVRYGSTAALLGSEGECRLDSPTNPPDPSQCPLNSLANDSARMAYRDLVGLPDQLMGQTCMHLGLQLAEVILAHNRQQGRPQAVLFLTDGQFTPGECPSGSSIVSEDQGYLADAVRHLGQGGVVTYSVLLGGEPNTSVSDMLDDQTGGQTFRADRAEDLLVAFSRLYAKLQPSRYAEELQTDDQNNLVLETTGEQAVTAINFIVEHDQAAAVRQGDKLIQEGNLPGGGAMTILEDNNPAGAPQYDIIRLTGNGLAGAWRVELRPGARRGLAVVDARVAPALRFPRAASIFAPRHVAQRDDGYLIEPVALRDGQVIDMKVTAPGQRVGGDVPTLRTLSPTEVQQPIAIQAGDEPNPLQLRREFDIRPGSYPRLEVVAAELTDGDGTRLSVRWSQPEQVTGETRVEAIIVDQEGGAVHRTEPFTCDGATCVYERFSVEPGHAYDVWFLATGSLTNGTLFSDYATAQLKSRSIIAIRGLPDTINLIQNPGPFEVEVSVRAVEPPGEVRVEVYDRQTGGLLPLTATLALDSPLAPNSTTTGRLIFENLSSLPPMAYVGDVVFRATGEVAVSPERLALSYAPGIQLSGLPGSIALNQGRGPFPFEATLNSAAGATALQAELLGPGGQRLPITPVLSLDLLQPGQPTPGQLSFQVPAELSAGTFAGQLVFSSPEGVPVEPRQIPVSLLVAPAAVTLREPPSLLDFGYWLDPSRPLTVTLPLRYEPAVVALRAELEDVSPNVPLEMVIERPTDSAPGDYRPEIALQLGEGALPTGDISGLIRFRVEDAAGGKVEPETLRFHVARPPAWFVHVWCNEKYPSAWAAQRQFCWFLPLKYNAQPTREQPAGWQLVWLSGLRCLGAGFFGLFVLAAIRQATAPKKPRQRDDESGTRRTPRDGHRTRGGSRRTSSRRSAREQDRRRARRDRPPRDRASRRPSDRRRPRTRSERRSARR